MQHITLRESRRVTSLEGPCCHSHGSPMRTGKAIKCNLIKHEILRYPPARRSGDRAVVRAPPTAGALPHTAGTGRRAEAGWPGAALVAVTPSGGRTRERGTAGLSPHTGSGPTA
jgi:hypothetical protein